METLQSAARTCVFLLTIALAATSMGQTGNQGSIEGTKSRASDG